MTDAVPSDHATVDSHTVHLGTVGRTTRRRVAIPASLDCRDGDVVALSIAGENYHAQVVTGLDGEPVLQGAAATRALARTDEGTNELWAWLDGTAITPGDALVLDVLTPGYAYGLRRPGERVVYSPPEPPDSSLTAIARDLDDT